MSYPIKKDKKYVPKIAQPNVEDEDDDGPLTADFIKLQRITPPAIQDSNEQETGIGIGKASKIAQLLKDPHRFKPKGRSNNRKTNKSNIIGNYPALIKEIEKEALKEQEKLLSNAFLKPLTEKGIKVNNFKTVYKK